MTYDIRLSIPTTRHATYRVTGTDFQGLRDQMSDRGEWGQYGGSLTVDPRGRPVLTRVTIAARPVITLPEWRDYSDGSPAQRREWDRMLAALTIHEDEHDAILRRVAGDFHQTLVSASPQLERREVQRLAREMVQRHFDEQNDFDRRTSHGQTTGVELRDV